MMMDLVQQAQLIVGGASLEDKLYPIEYTEFNVKSLRPLIVDPGRNKKIQFSHDQIKFPTKKKLLIDEGKALALHFFANHELLAIEMMALAILKYPLIGKKGDFFRKNIISTIKDEQKHFLLYTERMKEFGVEFGDYPVNNFFWKHIHECESIESFYAMMALTFESANLDFADYYGSLFSQIGDDKTSNILKKVLEDEIRHVSIGWNYLQSSKQNNIWSYYLSLLPEKITPSRSKGSIFRPSLRKKAGMDEQFISELTHYKDGFKITNRKLWKKSDCP